MKIYSWNILFRNKRLDEAFEFVSSTDFDVFCLQEVPESFLARLETLPYSLVKRIDAERIVSSGITLCYNIILSKHPIVRQGELPFPNYWLELPLRSHLFVRLMRLFHFSELRNRGGLFADIQVPGRAEPIRVFNLHLLLAHPERRAREFEQAMIEHHPSSPAIICGDFNIVESPKVSLLNWLFGGRLSDALFFTRERFSVEKRFVELELTNALRGKVTHPFSRSQLDHILVSSHFFVASAVVIPELNGSDHHPIFAELA